MKKIKEVLKRKHSDKNYEKFNKLHSIFAIIYLVQLILLGVLGGKQWVSITTNYLAYDTLLSNDGRVVHTAATSRLFDLDIVWILAFMLLVSFIGHLFLGVIYNKRYQAQLSKDTVTMKWLVYGVVSSLVVLLLALLSGVFDLSTLLLIVIISLSVALLGVLYHKVLRQDDGLAKHSKFGIVVAALVPWLILDIYVWGTIVYGGNSINAYVYYLYLTFLAAQIGLIYIIKNIYNNNGKWKNNYYKEKLFFGLILVLQTLVIWQVYFGGIK